ncbi:hypothetical protein [Oceanobacillus rekensis]|uniref:hypothetical protein n=1 Tax=Oceanobacillus rekensis TaxID=937927 RepID=UPI001FE746D9|nr:hypothetical protein [Oceanobacillus rekensis]
MLTRKVVDYMHLEWFDRVCGELEDSVHLICEKYDITCRMLIERREKHPRIDFFSDRAEGNRSYFFTLFFDPPNDEFYFQSIDPYYGHMSKVVLNDLKDIIHVVHESVQNYIDDDLSEEEILEDGLYLEETDGDWESSEVIPIYKEDEAEMSYMFSLTEDTGEGVIKRMIRKSTNDGNQLEEETIISLSKEEAGKLIGMIASHISPMNIMDHHV